MRARSWNACDFDAENRASLRCVCGVVGADDAKLLVETRASFLQILRRMRACRAQKQMQKCARSAGVRHEKRAILAPKFVDVCAACAGLSPPMTRNFSAENRAYFCRFSVERARAARKTKCKNARAQLESLRF